MFKKPLFKESALLLLGIAVLHLLAVIFYLYWQWGEFDSLMHFLGGLWVSLTFLWLYFFSGIFQPAQRTLSRFIFISTLGLIFVAVAWEIFELLAKVTFVYWKDYFSDTALDFVMDFLGSIAGAFYGYMRELGFEKQTQNVLTLPETPTEAITEKDE